MIFEKALNILLIEDNSDHTEMIKRCLSETKIPNHLFHASDGQMALEFLRSEGEFADSAEHPRPGLILLDLRLPKIDGLEVLQQIKNDERYCDIPVVVLSSSAAELDVSKAYDFKANSYLVKPTEFKAFMDMIERLGQYWLTWNQRP